MRRLFTIILSAIVVTGFFSPVVAEKDGQKCDKKQCKRKHKHGSKMFKYMDKNQDKKISKEEWTSHFDDMDENKDGVLTREEVRKYHKNQHKKN